MAVADEGLNKIFIFLRSGGTFPTSPDQEFTLTHQPLTLDLSQDGNNIFVVGNNLTAKLFKSTLTPKSFSLSQTIDVAATTGNGALTPTSVTNFCHFSRDHQTLIIIAQEKFAFEYLLNTGSGDYEFRSQISLGLGAGQTIKSLKLIETTLAIGTSTRLLLFRTTSSTFAKFQEVPSCDTVSVDLTQD